ncbi:MAG: DUF456 domain-containing protein [Alistipes sp.]|nr:DUF456 domain-containing protein [Alistipes sp.]
MEVFLAIMAVLLTVIGAVGCIAPVLPGVVLSYGGLLCAFFREGSTLSPTLLWVWLAIVVVVSLVDYFMPAYMTKIFGGSRQATIGATIGAIGGFFLGPLGIIAGPFIGALVGEMMHNRNDLNGAIKVGLGSFLSFIVGTGIKLLAASGMLIYVCRDIFFN